MDRINEEKFDNCVLVILGSFITLVYMVVLFYELKHGILLAYLRDDSTDLFNTIIALIGVPFVGMDKVLMSVCNSSSILLMFLGKSLAFLYYGVVIGFIQMLAKRIFEIVAGVVIRHRYYS